jgi:4-hydroxy-tetrahydrodipicolinate reductase
VTRVAIIGAAGRMGRALLRAAPEFSDLTIAAAVAPRTSSALGQDAGELAGVGANGVKITGDLKSALAQTDVAIDFSNAEATRSNLTACRDAGKALLIGTTGWSADLSAEFDAASKHIPLLVAPNTSVGVTLLIELVREAARALPAAGFDIEIIEAHHRMKRDAPSGTALALGRAAAEARGQVFERVAAIAAHPGGTSQPEVARPENIPPAGSRSQGLRSDAPGSDGQIGFAVVRGGDIVGEHTVLFAGTGERLALSHQATDRAIFARGALQAAAWLASRPAGRYFMRDLVTLKSGS